jgi:hypothetical protein
MLAHGVPDHPRGRYYSIIFERYFLKDALSRVDLVPDIAGFFEAG